MRLEGKRILITGASSGIGADLARQLGAEGAKLILSARRVAELEALAAQVGGAQVIPADLSTPGGADALAAAAGEVDILINNAGVDLLGRPWKEGLADRGDRLFQINTLSALRLTNRLLGGMVARREGMVVFISSISAWMPFPGGAYYAASKAALARAAETIRIDLKGTGVRVLAVYPGPIMTPMLEKALATEAGRRFFQRLPIGDSVALTRRTLNAMRRDDESVVYPSVYQTGIWFGGIARWFLGKTAPKAKAAPAKASS
jgi:short-subunit dehydrogenase